MAPVEEETRERRLPVLRSHVDPRSEIYLGNRAGMLERLAALDEQQALARAGGGTRYTERHRARGRMLARERIELLVDEDAAFLELSTIAAWGTDYTVGASVVTGIGVISHTECMIIAHDPTVRGGASNTRLQVEHPVTEAVTGLDLVALQLAVAEGAPLPDSALRPTITGHAVEARLYAEDPLADFLPAGGTLHRFEIPGAVADDDRAIRLRVDSGFASGDVVPGDYDPMLAKVIAHGPTRADAVRRLAAGLRRARVHGVTTNRDLLVGVLEHPEFAAGRIDTHFLDRFPPATLAAGIADPAELGWYALAASLAGQANERATASVWADAPSGWRNNRSSPQIRRWHSGHGIVEIGYALGAEVRVEVDGQPVEVAVGAVRPGSVDLVVGGVRRRFDVDTDGPCAWVDSARGSVRLTREPRFPEPESAVAAGSLVAPMPATVVRVEVTEGDRVTRGQVLLVLEAMKMEHRVVAPYDGTASRVNVKVGAGVDAGSPLIVIEADGTEEEQG